MYNWRLLLIKEFLQHSSPDSLVFVIIHPFSRARSEFSSSLRNIMKQVSGENKFCRRMFSSSNCLLTSALTKFLPSFFLPWTFIVYFTLTILFFILFYRGSKEFTLITRHKCAKSNKFLASKWVYFKLKARVDFLIYLQQVVFL